MELKERKTFMGMETDIKKGIFSLRYYPCIYLGDSNVIYTDETGHFYIKFTLQV
jgi:hypothetical protein